MAKRIGTSRRKTRQLYSVSPARKGKVSIRTYLQEFSEGQKVFIGIDPAVHEALPFRRFVGRSGIVLGRQGSAYRLRVEDGGKTKTLLVHPAHLRAMRE